MNKKEERKTNDNLVNKLKLNIIQREIKNTDLEDLSNKSHKIQRPSEILSKFENKYSINKRNESSYISLKTFKTIFKNKNKELKEYRESLDRKIELLKSKINEKNLLKGRNKKMKNASEDKILETTLKDSGINIFIFI